MRPVPTAAVNLIKRFEQGPNGGPALTRYKCPAGYPTIGYGHLIHGKDDPLWSATLTPQQAEDLAAKDLQNVAQQLFLDLGLAKIQSLTEGQWAAILSFTFNMGIGNFMTSTLSHKIEAGDMDGAAAEFPKWVWAGKPPKRLAGLALRRAAEVKVFKS